MKERISCRESKEVTSSSTSTKHLRVTAPRSYVGRGAVMPVVDKITEVPVAEPTATEETVSEDQGEEDEVSDEGKEN